MADTMCKIISVTLWGRIKNNLAGLMSLAPYVSDNEEDFFVD